MNYATTFCRWRTPAAFTQLNTVIFVQCTASSQETYCIAVQYAGIINTLNKCISLLFHIYTISLYKAPPIPLLKNSTYVTRKWVMRHLDSVLWVDALYQICLLHNKALRNVEMWWYCSVEKVIRDWKQTYIKCIPRRGIKHFRSYVHNIIRTHHGTKSTRD